jgi:hypothetical protein
MKQAINLSYRGRKLQIRASVVAGEWQIWFYEDGQRVYLHSILPHDRMHELDAALLQARRDLEIDAIVVPVVRSWPAERKSEFDPPLSSEA